MRRPLKRSPAGFTLLELLVVLIIIGLLSAFAAPRYFSQVGRSKAQITRAQIELMDKAVIQYRIDTGHYPSTEMGLPALLAAPFSEAVWLGPYLKTTTLPLDQWEHAYVYRVPGADGREFDIISYGADGQPGGTGDDADIGNWP
ncbi:type II secretion system major pseudopilin GspG [Rugamonas sp. A1-17]|nr:type II secretion system major pseudopilin GspG [Rugamonas sp. A1-17]